MGYRWLDDLDVCFQRAGVPFSEVGRANSDVTNSPSWRNRGRPTSMQFNPTGVLCHHTASPAGVGDQSELNVLLHGNGEAPGPISQLFIGRTAKLYLVAAGRANHAGSGMAPWLGQQKTDGNACMIGIEVANSGMGERWSNPVIDTYARTVAALLDYYKFPLANVLIHADFSRKYFPGSKIDPSGPWIMQPNLPGGGRGTWDVGIWRSYIQSFRGGAPFPIPPNPFPQTGDEPVLTIIQCSDASASFVGLAWQSAAAGGPIMRTVEWIRTGEELGQLKSWGCPEIRLKHSEMYGITLLGDIPVGDSYAWQRSDFRHVVP